MQLNTVVAYAEQPMLSMCIVLPVDDIHYMVSMCVDDREGLTQAVSVTQTYITFYIEAQRNYSLSVVAYNPTVESDVIPNDAVTAYISTCIEDGEWKAATIY